MSLLNATNRRSGTSTIRSHRESALHADAGYTSTGSTRAQPGGEAQRAYVSYLPKIVKDLVVRAW
jgi:hypothetical protein